jgi:hypothetical protein
MPAMPELQQPFLDPIHIIHKIAEDHDNAAMTGQGGRLLERFRQGRRFRIRRARQELYAFVPAVGPDSS